MPPAPCRVAAGACRCRPGCRACACVRGVRCRFRCRYRFGLLDLLRYLFRICARKMPMDLKIIRNKARATQPANTAPVGLVYKASRHISFSEFSLALTPHSLWSTVSVSLLKNSEHGFAQRNRWSPPCAERQPPPPRRPPDRCTHRRSRRHATPRHRHVYDSPALKFTHDPNTGQQHSSGVRAMLLPQSPTSRLHISASPHCSARSARNLRNLRISASLSASSPSHSAPRLLFLSA